MRKIILLFIIFLSAIILGSCFTYPIENMTTNNSVNKKNYDACLACADNDECAVLTTGREVQCSKCNLNYISHNTKKELCLNSWDATPRGFGCSSDGDNYAPTKNGCHNGSSPDPIPSDEEVWTEDKCFNHFKETIKLQEKKTYKLCDRLTESICNNNCGNYCKWDIDDNEGTCKQL